MASPTKNLFTDDRKQTTMAYKNTHWKLVSVALITIALSHVNYGYDYFRSKPLPLAKATDSQEEFSFPEGGFSILFPKKPTASFSTTKVDDTIVKVHTYTVRERNTYEISYFDLPHNSDDPKITAYLLVGLRNYILSKLKGTLITEASIWLDNNEGRILEISIPKRGIAKAMIIVTHTRLYRVTVVPERSAENASNDAASSDASRFLKSVKLLAIDTSGEGEVEAYLRKNPELAKGAFAVDSGGTFLNARALDLPIPDYPEPARMARVKGTVIVKIVIDEQGNVIAAQAIAGPPSLQSSAVKAARRARFTPTANHGTPVKVLGQVMYNFL